MPDTDTYTRPSEDDIRLTKRLIEEKSRQGDQRALQAGGAASSTFWGLHTFTGRGVNAVIFGLPGTQINRLSQIAVSMTELSSGNVPFLGDATLAVYNVVPRDDGNVIVKFDISWGSPLTVQLNFVIVN